jgi:sulfite exporter TauE/SafE
MPIDWLAPGAALLSGLLGGAHCAAMCGGIATGFSAMGSNDRSHRGGWSRAIEANMGRVGGYVLAGAIAGGIGHGIVSVARMEWLTLGLRMLVGVVLIVVALRLMDRRNRLGFLSRPSAHAWKLLRPLQQRLMPADTGLKRVGLGVLWGWLPCGLSSTLLVAAWLQATAVNGALTMAAFGLGTLPVMLPLTWSGARLGQWLQQPGRRTGVAMIVLFAGVVTITAPWLMKMPELHGVLGVLGCLSLPT